MKTKEEAMDSVENTFKAFVLTLFAVAVAGLGFSAISCGGSRVESKTPNAAQGSGAQAPGVVDITTATAIERDLPRFFEANGTLAAEDQTDVAPPVAGRVVAVGVDLGTRVERGAMLVRLDDRDARIRLQQNEAELKQAQSSLRQAEEKIGLKPNQPFDPQRVAEVAAARAALDLAEKQLRRYENLVESGDVSRAAYDQQRSQRDQLREQYQAALDQARQNYAAVATARAAVQASQAQLAQAQKGLSDVVVYAPISGYVADRPVQLGEYVSASSKVATIVRTDPLRLRIDVPEQAISAIKTGQTVAVSVSDYPGQSFTGHVARISPSVNATSRTLTVEAEVTNPSNTLKPGQYAAVRILETNTAAAVLVPQRSVRKDADTNHIFIVRNGMVEDRSVQLGQTDGDQIEIRSGLNAGETMATSNLDQLKDGTPVRQ